MRWNQGRQYECCLRQDCSAAESKAMTTRRLLRRVCARRMELMKMGSRTCECMRACQGQAVSQAAAQPSHVTGVRADSILPFAVLGHPPEGIST